MNIDTLLNLIVTEQDRDELVDFLDSCYQSLFKEGGAGKIIESNKKFGPTLASILPKPINELDYTEASAILQEIITAVKDIPRIEIILATAPTETTMNDIARFVSEKTHTKSVVDIQIDPKILGGAIFMIDGKYIDTSVSGKLNNAFTNNTISDFVK